MTPQQFIAKWKRAQLSERSAAQQHFLDLCELLGQPKPAEADPEGAWYTFERGVHKTGGGEGWADVWMKGHFAWEYKRKRKNLQEAYKQLLLYREDLENPPLLAVCDIERFEIHTNFTSKPTIIHAFNLDGLAEPAHLDLLRKLFIDPKALEPGETTEEITKDVAERFASLAEGMGIRKIPAERAAHFLMKLMFCMFAEDIELLPDKLFTKLLNACHDDPDRLQRRLAELFQAMSKGGDFGVDPIPYFNGGLFADAEVVTLLGQEIGPLIRANQQDWSNVEPSIFGTLFERTLDPGKRSQIGAHYTSKDDILTLLNPVLMAPLRREWDEVRAECEKLWANFLAAKRGNNAGKRGKSPAALRKAFEKRLTDFGHRLADVKVLDPACGSGNFLYVTINLLLDLEKEVIAYASNHDLSWFPQVSPRQLAGLEINPYAQQLAQVVIWIGYLQWLHHNGFKTPSDPVLQPIENIRLMDAILDLSDPEHAREPEWPEAEFIVGNPPFLGDKKMRGELGDEYVGALRRLYEGRIPGQSDLCCYWFEKARALIQRGNSIRAGLLATQNIRGGASREVLTKIKQSGDIFFAVSDRDWILDGASVHVSLIGLDDGTEKRRCLDGQSVAVINANLSASADVTQAQRLLENSQLAFIGSCKGGPFDISEPEALQLLQAAGNPNGNPNSDVVRPVVNSDDLMMRRPQRWIIDNANLDLANACLYEAPHAIVRARVKPLREKNRDRWLRDNWWRPQRMRPEMRQAIRPQLRVIVTPTTSKHRIFCWLGNAVLPDHKLVVFAYSDDDFFGSLQARLHEIWARNVGTQLRERESALNYNVQSSFETYPFSKPTNSQRYVIAAAAKELDRLRTNWLNPPEWTREEILEFPGSVDGPWARFVHDPDSRGIGTVRYPRIVAKDRHCIPLLAKRTLTNLYNERPTWLDLAHRKLDEAVFAAYGWDPGLSDDEILGRLLELNLQRAAEEQRA